jgi:hypothetical protein
VDTARWSFALGILALAASPARAFDVVLNAQGEYVDAYLIDGTEPPKRVVFNDPDPADPTSIKGKPPRGGRHLNGRLCFFPKGFGHDGGFVIADDTYRESCVDRQTPQARCAVTNKRSKWYVGKDADGWGVFRKNGRWTGRVIQVDGAPPGGQEVQGAIDPQGCAFDANGNLWLTDVGHGNPGSSDGSLLVFFPGKRNRYDTYCFVDKTLGAPGMPAMDDAGNLYVPEPAALKVTKFAPPFPSSAADCATPEKLVTTPPTKTTFPAAGLGAAAGITRVPGSDHFYIGSVILPPLINEYDATGALVRAISPSGAPKNPLGIDVGSDETVYFAELNLDPVTFDTRCGSVARVRFDANGDPLPREELGKDLRFPDGVTVVDSKQLKVNWQKLPPSPSIDPARCGGE